MFEQYLTKTGRLSCKQPQELKNQWYIQRFQEVHGDKYDYTLVHYTTSTGNVEIICKKHGPFPQLPSHHLQGQGCPICAGTKAKNTSSVLKEFQAVHGCTYDYSLVQYVNNKTKVDIICPTHGTFPQRPSDHLNGQGCPKCQNHSQTILYIIRCNTTNLVKIGITNNLSNRIRSIGGNLEPIFHKQFENPRSIETILHTQFQGLRKTNYTVKNGNTEFFNLSESQVADLVRYLEGL